MKVVALLLAPVLLTGCYTYAPIELAAATPGMEVRARVSAATAAQIGPSLGMSDARLLSGSVVDRPADGLTLKVPSVPVGTVGAQEGLFQQILITRVELLELESKKLDNTRTRLAVAAGVVGAVALAATALRGHSSGESAVTDPPSNFTRVSLRVHAGRFFPLLGVAWPSLVRSVPSFSPASSARRSSGTISSCTAPPRRSSSTGCSFQRSIRLPAP